MKNKKVNTKIYYRVGEHIRFEDKKYSIFSIEVSADEIDMKEVNELEVIASNTNFYLNINNKITINIPMITS